MTQVSSSFIQGLLKYGIATPIALWLLYVGGNQLLAEVHQNTVEVHNNTSVLVQHAEATIRVEQALVRVERRQERIEAVNRQQCVNAAKNYAQWQECWNAGDGK